MARAAGRSRTQVAYSLEVCSPEVIRESEGPVSSQARSRD